jgi:hypothetical protein
MGIGVFLRSGGRRGTHRRSIESTTPASALAAPGHFRRGRHHRRGHEATTRHGTASRGISARSCFDSVAENRVSGPADWNGTASCLVLVTATKSYAVYNLLLIGMYYLELKCIHIVVTSFMVVRRVAWNMIHKLNGQLLTLQIHCLDYSQ